MNNSPRIKSITVKGLFNQFDHHIELNQEERITILHGINGVGKTTIFRMIHALFNSRFYVFNEIPFVFFMIKMSNGYSVEIERKKETNNSIAIYLNKQKINYPYTDATNFIKNISDMTWIKRVGDNVFYDKKSEDMLSLDDLIKRYQDMFLEKKHDVKINYKLKYPLFTRLIDISRLSSITKLSDESQKKKEFNHTVGVEASEMKQSFKNTMTEYAKKTQQLEQTFPFRLLNAPDNYTYEEIKKHIEILQNKRRRLKNIGLLPTADITTLDENSIDNLEAHHATVMSLYIKDNLEKLKVFDDLSSKIELLLKIINSKFYGKKIYITEDEGLTVKDSKDEKIDLTQLSSGEQHELVMFYDLIFKVEPNTLVMIDEPELSLHITWQNKFIDELKQIVEQAKFDVLIATHSPTIVGSNSHLMVGLGVNE